ncbi:MAG: diaminopimelate decarboxylase [Elusimicrobia bacterium]|nr:diaminopimelate decarboxylase [Elusimicrobiota bacterium]
MFKTIKNSLYIEGVKVEEIAEKFGTPLYLYSQTQMIENFRKFDLAFSFFPHLICYALKANSNLTIAKTLRQEGAGSDIVSGGELYRALLAGFNPKKIVFSGVGKTQSEMRIALKKNILAFNVESLEELKVLNSVAKAMGKKAPIAIRVNPDVDAGTHQHITTGKAENKFGIHKKFIFEAYKTAQSLKNISIQGIQAHIGSQITSTAPFVTLLKTLLNYVDELAKAGIKISHLDVGGGLGICYDKENPPSPQELSKAFTPHLKGRNLTLLFEPGRFLVGNAGILVTKVLYRKKSGTKTFIIVDAAMNDLARPALYDAYHEIVPVESKNRAKKTVDVVGPVCESGDYFARNRNLEIPEQNDLLAIKNTGAYGFAMSSQYNSRPRSAEVLVKGKKYSVIRRRENFLDLVCHEQ